LAIGIYVIALSYLVIVGFTSVIPQVFWPASDDSFDLECGDGLELLRHEVDELRLAYLSSNETDPTALRSTLGSWDLRLNALAKRCDEEPVELLRRYRYRVELRLDNFMRDDAPLANQVTETIGPTPDAPTPEKGDPTP
jgi:hypothetical protein